MSSAPPRDEQLLDARVVSLGTGSEALAFLHRAALSMGVATTSGEALYERIALLAREPFPDALAVLATFDPRVTLFHPECISGDPEATAALEDLLLSSGFGYDIACRDEHWKHLLEPRLHRVDGGLEELCCGQLDPSAARAFERDRGFTVVYAMGLTHERHLLATLALFVRQGLCDVERGTIEALIQHATIALARKRAEDELRAVAGHLQQSVGRRTRELSDTVTRLGLSESRLRALIDAVDHTALLVGLDGRVLAANKAAAGQAGRAIVEIVGVPTAELYPAELVEHRRQRSQEVLESGRAVHYTERLGGRVRECSLYPVHGADGQIRSFAGFARDVTEQAEMEQRLRQAAAFQKALFQSVSQGILVLDDEGAVSDCNRELLSSFAMEREEMVGRPGMSLCAELAAWERWEQEHASELSPGGASRHFELRMRRMDGSTFMARVGASRMASQGDSSAIVWVVRDVTDELLRVEQLEYLATHDDLTGLPNRLLFQDRLERARQHGRRYETGFALLLLDLDGFKEVNDRHGHELGDRLLTALGTRLRATLRASDTVSRLGGDEFAVLLPTPLSTRQAMEVGAKLLRALEKPFSVGGHELHVSASIGVSLFPEHEGERNQLLVRADRAMYAAKRSGGRQVVLASDEHEDRS